MVKRKPLQDILEMILLFLAFFLPGFLYPQTPEDLAAFMTRSTLIAVPQVLLLLYLLWLREGQSWGRYGVAAPRGRDLLPALAIFAGLISLLLVAAAVLRLLPFVPRRLLEQGFRFRLDRPTLLPLAGVFALTSAYREELFFRCYLITRLRQLGLPSWVAAASSTALFAAGHLYQGLSGLIVATLLGACFALVFLRLRNLHRLAIAHGLYNLTVLAATLFVGQAGTETPPGPFTSGVVSVIFNL